MPALKDGFRQTSRWLLILLMLCAAGSIPLGLWMKQVQLLLVSPSLPPLYPFPYWLIPPGILFFIFFISSLALGLICKAGLGLTQPLRWASWDATSYLLFLLVPAGLSFTWALRGVCLIKLLILVFGIFHASIKTRRELVQHCVAFLIFALAQFAFAPTSPLSWRNPIVSVSNSENYQLGSNSPLHRENFVNAKAFDFSNFTWDYWGAMQHAPVQAYSYGVAFLTLLFDAPVVNPESFFRIVQILYYFWFSLGCFGFYFFARNALGFSFTTSILGGMFYFFLNSYFLLGLSLNLPIVAGAYLQLPWTLWILNFARRTEAPGLALGAGLCLAASLWVLPPHPEPLLLASGFAFAYAILLNRDLPGWRKRIESPLLLTAGVVLGSMVVMLPIWHSHHLLESKIFGHLDKLFNGDSDEILGSWGSMTFFSSVIFLVAIFAFQARSLFREAKHRDHLIFFLTAFALLLVFCLMGNNNPLLPWLHQVIPVNFRHLDRMGAYLLLANIFFLLWVVEHYLWSPLSPWAEAMTLGAASRLLSGALFSVVLPAWGVAAVILITGIGLTLFRKSLNLTPRMLFGYRLTAWMIVPLLTGALLWRAYIPFANPLFPAPRPYLSFQAQVANFRSLGFLDRASLGYLSQRMANFEIELRAGGSETLKLFEEYFQEAKRRDIRTTRALTPRELADFYDAVGPLVDNFYQSRQHAIEFPTPLMMRFNDAKIFERLDRFSRILLGSRLTNEHIGAWAEGYLLHNRNQTMDTRFSVGYPPLNALYLLPGESFHQLGDYASPSAWMFSPEFVFSKNVRKLFNIAGVDEYLIDSAPWERGKKNGKDISDLVFQGQGAREELPLTLVQDTRSYGIAYLASSLTRIAPVEEKFKHLMPPIDDEYTAAEYRDLVNQSLKQLLSLGTKHAVLLESEGVAASEPVRQLAAENALQVQNVLGNKAVLQVSCNAPPCLVVLNVAALKGWKAFVDQVRVPIQRANFAFLAVEVPQGLHEVWMEYRPPAALWGMLITLLSCLVAVGVALRVPFETDNDHGAKS